MHYLHPLTLKSLDLLQLIPYTTNVNGNHTDLAYYKNIARQGNECQAVVYLSPGST